MAKKEKILGIWLDNMHLGDGAPVGKTYETVHYGPTFKKLGYQFELYPLEKNSDALLLKQVEEFRPDYIFMVAYKDHFQMETLKYIAEKYGTKTILWNGDDEHQWNIKDPWAGKKIAPYFDVCITTFRSMLPKYRKVVKKRTKVLETMWGANNLVFKPIKCKKDVDVSICGLANMDRNIWYNLVKEKFPEFQAFGYGWTQEHNKYLTLSQYVKTFNRTKVNVNYGFTEGNKLQIKGRDFEVPMTGSFLLTTYNKNLAPYFKFGKEIETYKDTDELIKKARYYVKHDTARNKIAKAGYQRAIKDHTYTKRFKDIFTKI